MKSLRLIIIPICILLLEGCTKPGQFRPTNDNITIANPSAELPLTLEPIATSEIPVLLAKNIEADLIFSNFKLVEANMLRLSSKVYYDLKFVDEEQFAISATFDEQGNIISH